MQNLRLLRWLTWSKVDLARKRNKMLYFLPTSITDYTTGKLDVSATTRLMYLLYQTKFGMIFAIIGLVSNQFYAFHTALFLSHCRDWMASYIYWFNNRVSEVGKGRGPLFLTGLITFASAFLINGAAWAAIDYGAGCVIMIQILPQNPQFNFPKTFPFKQCKRLR